MSKEIEFQGLKFKTSFDFSGAKSKDDYFNNVLIESLCKYQETLKSYFSEKLHVVFSYFITLKVAAYVVLGIALLSPVLKIPIVITAISLFVISLILIRKFNNDRAGYTMAISISEMTKIMEEVREDLIKNNNKNE